MKLVFTGFHLLFLLGSFGGFTVKNQAIERGLNQVIRIQQ